MDTVTVEQAKELAHAFSQYSRVLVANFMSTLDCEIAIDHCKRLRSIQDATGIELAAGLNSRIEQIEALREEL